MKGSIKPTLQGVVRKFVSMTGVAQPNVGKIEAAKASNLNKEQ